MFVSRVRYHSMDFFNNSVFKKMGYSVTRNLRRNRTVIPSLVRLIKALYFLPIILFETVDLCFLDRECIQPKKRHGTF